MTETSSQLLRELVRFIRESSAIVHYFSDFMVAISLYNVIFENGVVGAFINWLLVALLSAVIAELLKSQLPTPLRVIFMRRSST